MSPSFYILQGDCNIQKYWTDLYWWQNRDEKLPILLVYCKLLLILSSYKLLSQRLIKLSLSFEILVKLNKVASLDNFHFQPQKATLELQMYVWSFIRPLVCLSVTKTPSLSESIFQHHHHLHPSTFISWLLSFSACSCLNDYLLRGCSQITSFQNWPIWCFK